MNLKKLEQYKPYLLGLAVIFVLSLLVACSPTYMTFNGHTIEVSSLSSETVAWLEYYNSLTEEQRETISYFPGELIPYLPEEDVVTIEKPTTLMAKVIKVDLEHKQALISSNGVLYLANFENVDKLKSGYIVETVYSKQVEQEDSSAIIEIVPDSMTIISATYDLVGMYSDAVKVIWKDNIKLNEGSDAVVLNLDKLTNLSDADKVALVYCVGLDLEKIVRQGTVADAERNAMYIELEYLSAEPMDSLDVPNIDVSIELAEIEDESMPIEVGETEGEETTEFVESVEVAPQSSKTSMFKFNISKTKCTTDSSYGFVKYTDCVVYGEGSEISWELGTREENK